MIMGKTIKIALSSRDTHQKKFTFLPMLCSPSSTNKQVKVSHRRCASSSSSSSSSSSAASSTISEDPSSPKVGCMGQVKRNNKVVGVVPSIISFTSSTISSSTSTSTHHHHHHHVIRWDEPKNYTSNNNNNNNNIMKYSNLKRFFSTKSPKSVIPTFGGGSQRSKIGRNTTATCRSKNNSKGSLVNLVDMDPPLPVVQKQQGNHNNDDGEKMGTLWKRRSGGAPLESLRVQLIHHNNPTLPITITSTQ